MSRRLYGVGPVDELVRSRPRSIRVLYAAANRAQAKGKDPVASLVAAASAAGVQVELRDARALDDMCEPGARHQGVVAVAGDFTYADLDALLANEAPLLVVLDGVQDPHNLGAIIRSAYVLGAHGLVIPEHRAAAITPVVTKASAGATELLPIVQARNLVRTLEDLKQAGVWTCAVAASPTARPISTLNLAGSLALVLGAEGEGVRPLVARTCDLHAVIPMAAPGVGSLNVSVAAGIAVYEVARQRGTPSGGSPP